MPAREPYVSLSPTRNFSVLVVNISHPSVAPQLRGKWPEGLTHLNLSHNVTQKDLAQAAATLITMLEDPHDVAFLDEVLADAKTRTGFYETTGAF